MAKRQFEVREPESGLLVGSYTIEDISGDLDNYAVEEIQYTPPSLSDAINETIARINQYTGNIRSRFATNIAFQELAYSRKLQACVDWDTAGRPADLTPYQPLLDEVNATGTTPDTIYFVVTSNAAQWNLLLDGTEALRRTYAEQAKQVSVATELDPLYQSFILAIELAVK